MSVDPAILVTMSTVPTDADVEAFVEAVAKPVRRRDARTLLELYGKITGEPAVIWGPTIIGYGEYHYRYASGRTGSAGAAGFSPRPPATTIYLPDGFEDYVDDLALLGPHTLGKVCLYLKDLETNDMAVLERILRASYAKCSAPGFGQV